MMLLLILSSNHSIVFSPYYLILLFLTFLLIYPNTNIITARASKNPHLTKTESKRLKLYTPGPFDVKIIGTDDEARLSKGLPVVKILPSPIGDNECSGRSCCIQDINAPKKAIWGQILDFDNYVGKVPGILKECKNYFIGANNDGTINIKTKMVAGVLPGCNFEYCCDQIYSPLCDSITWKLDDEKKNDLADEMAGHWHVEDHPNKPGCCRVFYACDMIVKKCVPRPIVHFMTRKATKLATGWVKRMSEKNPGLSIPLEIQSSLRIMNNSGKEI